ncbi:MAG: calcium/sodium antiporter, partial [Pseudomonadota bacterium]
MTDFLFAGLGLVILLLAGDVLVRGAVNLAIRLGIPALIVSLTIVAFGTSAPELLISIKAVLENSPGIAIGNVVGSNTANILLVLGLPALIASIQTAESDTRKSYLMMIGGSLLFIVICFFGPITWLHGLILLAAILYVLWDQAREAMAHRAETGEEEELEEADDSMPSWKIGLFLVLGLIGLPLGADILVDAATNIARSYGVSETAIGLSLIAVGTSLPELATVAAAVYRKESDVVLGNVI